MVGTTHLESGKCDPYNLRVLQLHSALSFVDGPNSGCSVLAGDLNLREWESNVAKVVWGRGDGGVGGGQGVEREEGGVGEEKREWGVREQAPLGSCRREHPGRVEEASPL